MATLPSGLDEFVADEEPLARFLTQSNQFNNLMAKPAAFLPNPRDHETSVSRHGSQPLESLWALGLVATGGRSLHGAAIFKACAVRNAQLEVVSDEPPSRHAVIRGWPWTANDPELQKAQQKERAAVLASEAILLLRQTR